MLEGEHLAGLGVYSYIRFRPYLMRANEKHHDFGLGARGLIACFELRWMGGMNQASKQ
jgi:hypothetical protein